MTSIGAFMGSTPAQLSAYESWLGRPAGQVLGFFNQSSWDAFDSSVSWGLNQWADSGRQVVWSVPLTVDGTSLAAVAAGSQDQHFVDAARQMAQSRTDAGPIYVRLGWEFNGDWMPWSAAGHEQDFVSAFQHVETLFDSMSNRFKFVWDVNIGGGAIDPATAYPGDAYVDAIGLDLYYNTHWDSKDPAQAFNYSLERPFGLDWVSDFAATHGKQTTVSEWGVESDGAGPFIQKFADWMNQHDVLYANYWDSNAGGFAGELHDGTNPDAGAAYLKAFGGTVGSQTVQVADTLQIQVSADSYAGDPQFIVRVDGNQVGGVQTAHASHAAGQHDTITLQGDFGSDPHAVTVEFVNDAWGGRSDLDRNLYVEQITLGGHAVSGNLGSGDTGNAAGSAFGLWSNGQVSFDMRQNASPDTLILKVSADSYQGDPLFTVKVDGQQIGGIQTAHASHAAGQSDTITLAGDFGAHPQTVTVDFLNDAWGGRSDLDRNLYVNDIELASSKVAAGTEHVHEAPMGLWSAGAVDFHL